MPADITEAAEVFMAEDTMEASTAGIIMAAVTEETMIRMSSMLTVSIHP